MKKPLNTALILFIIICILSFAFGMEVSILFFLTFFQITGFYSVIKELITYNRSKRGLIVTGTVENVVEVKGDADSEDYYDTTISFYRSSTNEKITFSQQLKTIVPDGKMQVWINELNPSKSVAIAQYDFPWKLNKLLALLVLLGLFYVDYLIIKYGHLQ